MPRACPVVCCLVAVLAAGEADLAPLRQRLADDRAAVHARWRAADGTLRLVLAAAADRDDAELELPWFAGAWTAPGAVVPQWRPETVKEAFDARDAGRLPAVDRVRHAIDAGGLRWDGSRLSGTATVAWRLDATRAERMPPGAARWLSFEGFWSPLDLYQLPARQRPRQQRCRIDAARVPDAWHGHLRFTGLTASGAITTAVRLPAPPGEVLRPLSPGWNRGIHQADAAAVTVAGDRVGGALRLLLHPDTVHPRTTAVLAVALAGRIAADGTLSGTWTATRQQAAEQAQDQQAYCQAVMPRLIMPPADDGLALAGMLAGRLLPLVAGSYVSTGDLGELRGAVSGGWDAAAEPADVLADAPDMPVAALWQRAVAAARLRGQPGDARQALVDAALPAGVVAADVAALAAATPVAAAPPGLPGHGPWTGGAPLGRAAGDATLPAAADGWGHVTAWQVCGPLPWAARQGGPLPPAPAPTGAHAGWTEAAAAADGLLVPPPFGAAATARQPRPGHADACWLAAARLHAPAAGEWLLALAAAPGSALRAWVDDRLVIDCDGDDPAWQRPQRPCVPLRLAAGTHRLLVLAQQGRGEVWLRAALASAARPAPELLAVGTPTLVADADPPCAADLATGAGVRWSIPLPGLWTPRPGGGTEGGFVFPPAPGTPARCGDVLVAAVDPAALVAVDPRDGARRWTTTWNPCVGTPGEASWRADDAAAQVAALSAAGVTMKAGAAPTAIAGMAGDDAGVVIATTAGACIGVAADGSLRFQVRTGLTAPAIALAGDLVVLAGTPAPPRKAAAATWAGPAVPAEGVGVIAIARADGRVRWAVAGPGDGRFAIAVPGAVVVGGGVTYALADGVATPPAEPWPEVRMRMSPAGDGLALASVFGHGMADVVRQDNRVAVRLRWWRPVFAANRTAGSTLAIADGRRLWVPRRPEEFSKHDPATALMLDGADLGDGGAATRLKPLLRGRDVPGPGVIAGGRLYLSVHPGHASGATAGAGVQVVDVSGAQPAACGLIDLPGLGGTPLAWGDGLHVVAGDRLLCLGEQSEVRGLAGGPVGRSAGQRAQRQAGAAALLRGLMPEPAPAALPRIAVDAAQDAATATWAATPLDPGETFIDDQTSIRTWRRLPGTSDAPPADVAAWLASAAALPSAAMRERNRWFNWNRLDVWGFHQTWTEVDSVALAGDAAGAAWLAAVIDLPRPRDLLPVFAGEAAALRISGQAVAAQQAVRLDAGRHVVLAQLRPQALLARRPLPPVDVAAALAAGAATAVAWPTRWQVLGPRAAGAGMPAAEDWAAAGERAVAAGGLVDLGDLRQGSELSVWLRATVDIPAAGRLLVNASADWRMAWYDGGRAIYDTRAAGNQASHALLTAHSFLIDAPAGRRELLVEVQPGSKGCSLRSQGALVTGDPYAVAAAHPAARGAVAAPAPQPWLGIALRGLAGADEQRAAWRAQLAPLRARLAAIVADLPGTSEAAQAQRLLERSAP